MAADTEVSSLNTLLSLLTPEQRAHYLAGESFTFKSSEGNICQLNPNDYQGNIRIGGRWLCAHVAMDHDHPRSETGTGTAIGLGLLHMEDWYQPNSPKRREWYAQHHLAQYLMISADENAFMQVAL